MLDKFLTGENVKVNGEIAGRRHILRTLVRISQFTYYESRLGRGVKHYVIKFVSDLIQIDGFLHQ